LLSCLECEAGLIDLGFSLVEVAELFSRSDRNTDGSLSIEEFRAGAPRQYLYFCTSKASNDGALSIEEFRAGLV